MAKYAILTDSGSDIPPEYIRRCPIYVAPLSVIYGEKAYLDGIDITTDQIIARMPGEIPTTSMPSVALIEERIRQIKADGYDDVMAISISSNLSGTYNAMRVAAEGFPDMRFALIDTKNIAIGAGMVGAYAATLMDNYSLEEAEPMVRAIVGNSKVFFCIPTLDYLRKGGRIGLVAGFMGAALGLRPVITCNDDGIYTTVTKARGWTKAIETTLDQAVAFRQDARRYNLAIGHSGALEEAQAIDRLLKQRLPDYNEAFFGVISPALTVHVGPGLIGVGLQRLPD